MGCSGEVRSAVGKVVGAGGAGEEEEGEEGASRERQESRRAECCEWLKTRSERRMRSNLRSSSAPSASEERIAEKRGEGEDPQVKPCAREGEATS